MKKRMYRFLMTGVMAAAMLGMTACGSKTGTGDTAAAAAAAAAADSSAAGETASGEDIGFPKKETITLVVPGKAGGGSDLGIRYYSEGLNRIYGLKTTVTNYDSNTIGHQTVATAKPDGTTLTPTWYPAPGFMWDS